MAQKQKGGFFARLGKAIESLADSVANAAPKDLTNKIGNPLDNLKVGKIVSIAARINNTYIKLDANGTASCSGATQPSTDSTCQFEVMAPTGPNPRAFKLRSVAFPKFHLAIVNGYFLGYGTGGPECDFAASTYKDSNSISFTSWCVFESVLTPGSHIGVLPDGQFTTPAQTARDSNVAHFKVDLISEKDQSQPAPVVVAGGTEGTAAAAAANTTQEPAAPSAAQPQAQTGPTGKDEILPPAPVAHDPAPSYQPSAHPPPPSEHNISGDGQPPVLVAGGGDVAAGTTHESAGPSSEPQQPQTGPPGKVEAEISLPQAMDPPPSYSNDQTPGPNPLDTIPPKS